jgi:hypothetical protein
MMTAAEVKRLEEEREAHVERLIEVLEKVEESQAQKTDADDWRVIDLNRKGAARLIVDMTKIGVNDLAELADLAYLRKRPIYISRVHDYPWIHTHICEYLKQFHPSENQALLAENQALLKQARTAR